MKKPLFSCIIALMCTTGLMRCTTGPTAGTETGNPDITACLTAALSMFDSADAWIPSTYLTEGERQLDPGKVYTSSPNILLAKRNAGTEDVASDTARTTNLTLRVDTIIVVDTVIVRDTIVVDTIVLDTVKIRIDGDSMIAYLITQRVRYDSVFIVDTVLRRDTFYLYSTNIGMPVSTEVSGKEYSVDSVAKTESMTTTEYRIIRDSASRGIVLFQVPVNPKEADWKRSTVTATIRSDSAFIMVARQLTIGDAFVSETYRDADGDGFLATSAFGTDPMSTGTIVYRRGVRETVLRVDFDAGSDRYFSTTYDNRIHSLHRTRSNGNTVVERVRYGPLFFGQHGDTLYLQRDLAVVDDSLSDRSDRYICISGDNPLDHRKNRLACLTMTAAYCKGSIKKMEITVIPALPLSMGQKPATATLHAFIDFGKGLAGVVEASIDYKAGAITGKYAEGGIEYKMTYQHKGNMIELLRLEQ